MSPAFCVENAEKMMRETQEPRHREREATYYFSRKYICANFLGLHLESEHEVRVVSSGCRFIVELGIRAATECIMKSAGNEGQMQLQKGRKKEKIRIMMTS